MSAIHTIEIDEECPKCKGTGVYVGMAERDGACVVCHTCKGTGEHKYTITYKTFEGRKRHSEAKWVYQCNPGVVVGNNDKVKFSDFGGKPYDLWIRNGKFAYREEDRIHTCPAWWWQTCNYNLKPNWEECYSALGRSFSNCSYFKIRETCWTRWDEEFAGKWKEIYETE